jgi:Flp pilus assembly pilin Flp
MTVLVSFWQDDSGQSLSEYAVILALVSVTMLLVLVAFRDELGRVFGSIRVAFEEDVETLSKPGLGQGEGCPSVHGCNGSQGDGGT